MRWRCSAPGTPGCFRSQFARDGDFSANSLLVNQAVHFQLLIGNYSREGFNHPGPAFLYVLSFGQDIFYSWLHVVPAQYNGQLLAVFVLNGVLLALVGVVIARHAGSWAIALLALAVVVVLTGGTLDWASSWFPYLYAAPFLLAVVTGASVAAGSLRDLPTFTFAVALLVHGHVAFIGIIGLYAALVCATWLVLHRPRRNWVEQLRGVSRHLLASGGIVALFALPIVLDLALHWPGQFGLYLHYARTNSHLHPHSLTSVIHYVEAFWPGGHVGIALFGLAAVATAVLAATDPDRRRRLFVLCLLGGAIVATFELGLYGARGVDYLNLTYTGDFYYGIPAMLGALLLVEVLCRCRAVLEARRAHHRPGRMSLVPALLAAAVAALMFAMQPSTYSGYRGDPALPGVVNAIYRSPLRQGRSVAFSLGAIGLPGTDWADVTALMVAASRAGHQTCVTNPAWVFMVTSQNICSSQRIRSSWVLTAEPVDQHGPLGGRLVLRSPEFRHLRRRALPKLTRAVRSLVGVRECGFRCLS